MKNILLLFSKIIVVAWMGWSIATSIMAVVVMDWETGVMQLIGADIVQWYTMRVCLGTTVCTSAHLLEVLAGLLVVSFIVSLFLWFLFEKGDGHVSNYSSRV